MNAQSFSRPAKYNVHNLPWRKHPLDPDGRMIVMSMDKGARYSIAQTKFTDDYKFEVIWISPENKIIRSSPVNHLDFAVWLEYFEDVELRFNDDAYAREVAA